MRPSARAAILGATALVVLSTSLLFYFREVWQPMVQPSNVNPPSQSSADNTFEVTTATYDGALAEWEPTPSDLQAPAASTIELQETSGNYDHLSSNLTKAVVMARLSTEDTSWIHTDLPDWDPQIYSVNDPHAPTLHTQLNKGRESLAYLTYLTTNYHTLPNIIAFIHPHKDGYPSAWHTDNDAHSNVESLRTLQLPFVQKQGYVNLRCNAEVGCNPPEIQLNRSPPDPTLHAELAMPSAWRALMGEDVPLPDTIAVACCAQFAVSRERVLERPLADYERYLRWVVETELEDEVSGRVMEYLWHVIFGRRAVFCPEISGCYCKVYGRCSWPVE